VVRDQHSDLIVMLNKIKKIFLDLIFPISCIGCGKGDKLVCDKCYCSLLDNLNHVKKSSLSSLYIDNILVAFDYRFTLAAKLIKNFKYNFIFGLDNYLASLLISFIADYPISKIDCIIPIPLSKKRKNWRGFNQSYLLANVIGNYYDILVNRDIISRKINNRPQVGLNAESRKQNIKGIFEINNYYNLKNKKILLVDDVITTGSTLNECAKLLKEKGSLGFGIS